MTDINEAILWLNDRSIEYEKGHPTVSDKEWDDKYFQLKDALSNHVVTDDAVLHINPVEQVNPAFNLSTISELKRVEHNHEMLSLDKTKSIFSVLDFLQNHDYCAMAKMDGLTCSLRYVNGRLVSAETRGNGFVGEDVTHNAQVISTIPKIIDYTDELIVDGEIISTYQNFEKFNGLYKNPRNFAAGSIRLLDPKECAARGLTFIAWDVIEGFNDIDTFIDKLDALGKLGFKIVPWSVDNDLQQVVDNVKNEASLNSYPIDGVVFKFNDIEYGKSLGKTSHHFKNAIAYKFYDELMVSYLEDIEWTMGRIGTLTPVAVFQPIEMDGSTIQRASLHNLSVLKDLLGVPYKGQEVQVFKANMIIPQISEAIKINPTEDYEYEPIPFPTVCPICGETLEVITNDDVMNYYCPNPNCAGKAVNQFDHFCGKKGLDIKGLSKATLEKLLDWGWIEKFHDIFLLSQYKKEWGKKPGFGAKSVENILNAINASKTTTLEKFISSLGISLIGSTVSKDICKHVNSYEDFRNKCLTHFNFTQWEGFADSKTQALWDYDFTEANKVYDLLTIVEDEKSDVKLTLEGKVIVITGRLNQFKNRNELQKAIEERGGKVVGSISKKTSYLINNDIKSDSAKNKSDKELGIPIITEAEFKEQFID